MSPALCSVFDELSGPRNYLPQRPRPSLAHLPAAGHVGLGHLELRGALARKPELFLRLGGPAASSRIWLGPILEIESRATTRVISRRANAGQRANFGGPEFRRACFSARIFARTNVASRDCSLGDLLAHGNIDNRCVGRPRRQRSCAG